VTRAFGLRLVLIVLVVAGATLFGGLARQAWSDSQAHGHMMAARIGALAALRHARAVGVPVSRLAPLQTRLRTLDSTAAPSATLIVGTEATRFYDGQARSYREVRRAIYRTINQVTAEMRTQARAVLSDLASEMRTARALRLHPLHADAVYQSSLQAISLSSTTPRQYATLLASLQPARSTLRKSIAARQAAIGTIVSSAGNSVAGIQKRAEAEVGSVMPQVALLTLVSSHAPELSATLLSAQHVVDDQSSVTSAAAADVELGSRISYVRSVLARDLPARMIVVSTEKQWAWMYQNGNPVYNTPVTTGGPELPTYHGVFHIYMKVTPWVFHSPFPPGSPYYYNPTPITYWMPFDGQQGLHDAWWRSNFGPGSNVQPTDLGNGNTILGTHGCVNLPMAAAQFVWNWAPLGTTVVVN